MKLHKITLRNALVIIGCSFAACLAMWLAGFEPAYMPPPKKTDTELIREGGAALEALCHQNPDKC